MYIKTTCVYEKDGIIGYACGYKPEGDNVTILEEREILYPEDGYEPERISDKEKFSAVWLKGEDKKENYSEVELAKPEAEGTEEEKTEL